LTYLGVSAESSFCFRGADIKTVIGGLTGKLTLCARFRLTPEGRVREKRSINGLCAPCVLCG